MLRKIALAACIVVSPCIHAQPAVPPSGTYEPNDSVFHNRTCLSSTGTHIVYKDQKDHCISSPGGLMWEGGGDHVGRLKLPAWQAKNHFQWPPHGTTEENSKKANPSAQ